ncbi:MAG TPA: citrate synthase [Gemmatimonadaceae bacterium]|nr:citrate synthase [Gemmatimonadaceae bacterium]
MTARSSRPSSRPADARAPRAAPAGTLSAAEAARELGVRQRTLYAYVSRGLLPSLPDPDHPRQRRYPAAAVRRLKAHRAARRDPALGSRAAARGSLAWGEPVLESAITLITPERPYYRGHDALALAASTGFERVAELLWLGTPPVAGHAGWPAGDGSAGAPAPDAVATAVAAAWRSTAADRALTPITAAQVALPIAAALDPASADRTPAGAARAGRHILELLTVLATGPTERSGAGDEREAAARQARAPAPSIAERLARAWAPRCDGAVALYDAALVLVADHELNAAALAARVVASTSGSPYAAVAAGLAALQGTGHGGHTAHISALLDAAAEVVAEASDDPAGDDDGAIAALRAMVRRRRRRGERVAGFGHRLYPAGDPRARFLLERARERLVVRRSPDDAAARTVELARALAQAVREESGDRPTVDYALAAIGRATGAPAHAPLTLFALGRAAGLVAHAIEQYGAGRVLRARAQYVGPVPREEG